MAVSQTEKGQVKRRSRCKKEKVICNTLKSEGNKRKRCSDVNSLYENDDIKSAVMRQAQEVLANLAPEFPSIIKCMLPSHVTGGFWLGLPKKFCEVHLPMEDADIYLEDESGNISKTKYLVEKVGLSARWRGFSIDHKLIAGDALVFQLVKANKLKVYIIKVSGSDEVSGALGLLNLDASNRQMDPENQLNITDERMESQYVKPLEIENDEAIKKNSGMVYGAVPVAAVIDLFTNESEELSSEVSDGIRLSESTVDFYHVKSFEDFNIVVNDLVINTEFSTHIRKKYYELCCSQHSLLHDCLLAGLNCKLIVGVIAETVNIADAIRASKLSTSLDNFVIWEKTLKSFQTLGMNIGFLLARLDSLMILATKSKSFNEAELERQNAEQEKQILESKLSELQATIDRLDTEIEKMEVNSDDFELLFQQVAEEPW